ncbi:MAG TPA: bestrophin family ion channel [Chroococcales cyanobacterium]
MARTKHKFAVLFPGGKLFWKCMLVIVLYSCLVVWSDDHYFPKQKFDEVASVLVTSVVLGLLMAFRTNSAYDRWWEGRKLWGQLVNEMRNLSIKLATYIPDKDEQEQFLNLIVAFPYALRDHLRDQEPSPELLRVSPLATSVPYVPGYLTKQMYRSIFAWKRSGQIDGFEFRSFDEHARAMMDICGACERIKKSPIAGSYKNMIWLSLGLYALILPWLLTPAIDLWTIPVVFVTAYFVLGVELLAEEVEEPFGSGVNDLPLDLICAGIETSVTKLVIEGDHTVNLLSSSQTTLTPAD